jgi:hypothetical protein
MISCERSSASVQPAGRVVPVDGGVCGFVVVVVFAVVGGVDVGGVDVGGVDVVEAGGTDVRGRVVGTVPDAEHPASNTSPVTGASSQELRRRGGRVGAVMGDRSSHLAGSEMVQGR